MWWVILLCPIHCVQDCFATPGDCLKITCTISQLQGLAGNEARISFRGYVDERFFSVSYVIYLHNVC